MIRRLAANLAALLVASTLFAAPARAAGDLLVRMAAVNPNLHAFSATMHAHVAMKSFPFLTADLTGNYYYKEPDKYKVVFTHGVPILAQQFDQLHAHIGDPAKWHELYVVTVVSDDGKTTLFKLVPRKHGNIDSIDAKADDRNATITSMRWNYANGGYAELTNHYGRVGENFVVESQDGHVDEPGYVADIASTIDDYKINPSLSDSIFTSP